ncbi:hypothetical protein [Pseudoduganella umbonata]|uniref:Uncharacterized protein n=1 Tax=Pseudoduganella umbonata TaxID=864828 RepID=A0A4P8HPX6_9BURK|nr:hypothetical protein [Pseudoduganella umbonata]MBB3220723.1 hypothetical protein [Pseudoduganella umbonata]QCP11797.1 hypothetical protein FCL38_16255 [Pseudoduganella umbonata]
MNIYRAEGLAAYAEYAKAAGEEYAVAHELAQCAKVEVYHLLAAELFIRVKEARQAATVAFEKLTRFEGEMAVGR